MDVKDLTPKEIFLLSILYELKDADIYDILNYVQNEDEWQYASVEIYLTFLFKKGYVERQKIGRRYRYQPKVSLTDVVTRVFDRLFRGLLKKDPNPLINYFIPPSSKVSDRERQVLSDLMIALKERSSE